MQSPGDFEISRRDLLVGAATTVAVTAIPSIGSAQAPVGSAQAAGAGAPVVSKVSFNVNGTVRELSQWWGLAPCQPPSVSFLGRFEETSCHPSHDVAAPRTSGCRSVERTPIGSLWLIPSKPTKARWPPVDLTG